MSRKISEKTIRQYLAECSRLSGELASTAEKLAEAYGKLNDAIKEGDAYSPYISGRPALEIMSYDSGSAGDIYAVTREFVMRKHAFEGIIHQRRGTKAK